MANFKVSTEGISKETRLYLMEICMGEFDKPVYKFGKASGHSSKKRMLEIVGSYFDKYRVTPAICIVRDRKVTDVFKKESSLHREFKEQKIQPEFKFSGHSECFHLDKEQAIEAYEKVCS